MLKGIASPQAGIATAAAATATDAATSAMQAAVAAQGGAGMLDSSVTAGGALPYEVSQIAGGVGTGSGGTPGEYALTVTGGPAGHVAYGTVGSDGKVAGYRIGQRGIATTNTAPTYAWPSGANLTAPTLPTATVSAIPAGRIFFAPSADGLQKLAWVASGGVIAAYSVGGLQWAEYFKAGVDGASVPTFAEAFTRAGYLGTNGTFIADVNWGTTELLEISQTIVKQIKLYGATNVCSVAFYDVNRAFISGSSAASLGAYVTTYPSIPANAVYVAFTDKVSDRANEIFRIVGKPVSLVASAPATTDQAALFAGLFTRQGYYSNAAGFGAYVADTNWRSTPLLEVAYLGVSRLNLYGHTATCTIAFFDADGAFISGTTAGSIGARVTTYPSVPSNAFYVGFTTWNATISGDIFVPVNKAATSPWRSDFALSLSVTSLITTVGYIGTNGALNTDANWLCTDFLALTAGEKVAFTVYGNAAVCSIAFYDSGHTFISGLTQAGSYTAVATAPANTAYYRLTTGKPGTGSVPGGFVYSATYKMQLDRYFRQQLAPAASASVFSLTPFKRPGTVRLASGMKVVLYGDSRMSTDYAFIASNFAALLPAGVTVSVKGISGSSLATQLSAANLSALAAENADVIIWLTGGNDNGAAGSIGSITGAVIGEPTVAPVTYSGGSYTGTYFAQGLDYFGQWFKATYYNIRARAALTGSETETQKNDKIRAVKKPMLIVCTDLPQKRNNSSDPFTQAANLERKRQAFIEFGNKWAFHTVDTMKAVGWDMSLEPYWTSPTVTTNNQGVWTMDGLHPNEFGNMIMNEIILSDAGLI